MAIQWIGKPVLFFTSAARSAARLCALRASESMVCEVRMWQAKSLAQSTNRTRAQLEGVSRCDRTCFKQVRALRARLCALRASESMVCEVRMWQVLC